MQARSALRSVIASAIIFGITLGSSLNSLAQDGRPRYGSRHSQDSGWAVAEDTIISVRMNGNLNSKISHVGDKFAATVDVPVYVNGKAVIPAGSIVEGRVIQVTPAKRMGRSGSIAIDFDDLVFPSGARIPINGNLTSDDPETRRRIDDESRVSGGDGRRTGVFVGGGGAVGAVLGGIAGGGKGAAVGGAIGAGAGIAAVLLSKGQEAEVPSGTLFGIQLRQAMVIREEYINTSSAGQYRHSDQNTDPVGDPQPPRSQPADPIRTEPADTRSVDTRPAETRPDETRPADARPDEPMPDSAEPEPEPRTEQPAPSGPPLPLSSPEMIRRAQVALKEQGYYEGEPDGALSPRLSNSIKVFQRENNLPDTGELDQQTAGKLGILGASSVADKRPGNIGSGGGTGAGTSRPGNRMEDRNTDSRTVVATVLSATANRMADGAIYVVINTQANTGGWRWYGEHVVNGDTLEVYARAVRPTGMVTQALTRGKIELNVMDGVQYVRRVVIHSAGADQVISLGSRGSSSSGANTNSTAATNTGANANVGANLQRQAEDLLSEYKRLYNSSQSRDVEVELFFALDNFANSARLYAGLVPSLQDQQGLRRATLALARQARRTDIAMTSSQAPRPLMLKWDAIRQDVLRLMQTYGIASAELDD